MTAIMLDRPLYRIVADQIESRILEGLYAPGETLPAELALEQEFNVSRITIRQALGVLKRRGILGSRSGVGTFVRLGAIDQNAVRMSGSLSELIYYSSKARYTPLGRELVAPPAEVAAYLGTPPGATVFCFSGKRSNFCLEQIYVPVEFGHGLDNSRLGKAPLFAKLEEINHVKVAEVEQVITAVSARAALARQLGVQDRSAVLKATRIYRLADQRVAEVSVSHYDPLRFNYVMNLFVD